MISANTWTILIGVFESPNTAVSGGKKERITGKAVRGGIAFQRKTVAVSKRPRDRIIVSVIRNKRRMEQCYRGNAQDHRYNNNSQKKFTIRTGDGERVHAATILNVSGQMLHCPVVSCYFFFNELLHGVFVDAARKLERSISNIFHIELHPLRL